MNRPGVFVARSMTRLTGLFLTPVLLTGALLTGALLTGCSDGPAGGSADVVARLLADGLSRETGKPVIVDPKPGGAGVIAVNELSRAARDGHTLLVGVNSLVSEIPHVVKLRVDMAQEINPMAELARAGLVMVGTPSLPAGSRTSMGSHAVAIASATVPARRERSQRIRMVPTRNRINDCAPAT